MIAAAPIQAGPAIHGAVYGGMLVNRNHDSRTPSMTSYTTKRNTKRVCQLGQPLFSWTTRVSRPRSGGWMVTARWPTRVSREVADQVLDNGTPWVGEAFVVKEWYLTAYEPIRDGGDQIIGMVLCVRIWNARSRTIPATLPFVTSSSRCSRCWWVLRLLSIWPGGCPSPSTASWRHQTACNEARSPGR